MRTILKVAWLGLLALTLSSCAHLRGTPLLEPGQRVRVQVREAEPPRRTGAVVALTVDSLALAEESGAPDGGDGPRVAFPVAAIKRVDISTGVHLQTIEGLHCGGEAGLITMLIGTLADEWLAGDAQSFRAFAVCVVAGGTIGTLVRREEWRRLPLSCVRVSFGPLEEGEFRVGVSVVLHR